MEMESKSLERRRRSCSSDDNREKKVKRREVLAKKKALQQLIEAASSHAHNDNLASFPTYRHFFTNGLNMEGPYGSEWPGEEKVKRREMVAPEAHYIFVHEVANPNSNANEKMMTTTMISTTEKTSTSSSLEDSGGPLVGFVQYRFVLEEETPVLYVYELQLEPRVQGKGLGEFLMQLIEVMAQKNSMGAVMLTVQKANTVAMNFYTSKLRYVISSMSPSRVNPMIGIEKSYEILCKTFTDEAKTILEVGEN